MAPNKPRSLIGGYADQMPGPRRRWRPYFELDLAEKETAGLEFEKAQQELARLKSLRPVPLIRTAKHLERKQRKLEERLTQLQEEINRFEGIERTGVDTFQD